MPNFRQNSGGMVQVLGNKPSVLNRFISEMRNVDVQGDRMRFRRNLERCGELMAYEISKVLHSEEQEVVTPLGTHRSKLPAEALVIATILRAGLPLHQGLLSYFDDAENAVISAYRKPGHGNDFTIEIEYLSSPSMKGKTLILCDSMLATGRSMVLAWEAIVAERGTPNHTHIATVLASEEGLEYCQKHITGPVSFWIGELDPELNSKSYIVPGLGDAGDLAYGSKL